MLKLQGKQKKTKKGRKSYYYKFFMSFVTVLFVPMLTIALIFLASQSTIRQQIVTASQNTLYQFFSRVDDVVNEARNISVSIINSGDGMFYSKKIIDQFEKRALYSWKIKQLLGNHMREKYEDIFVYYPDKDYIVSAQYASMNLKSYYELYYAGEDVDFWEDFRAVAESPTKKPMLYCVNVDTSDSYLCISMRQSSYRREKYDYVLVVVLKPDYVRELLGKVEVVEQNGVSMILNGQQEEIFSTANVAYEEVLESGDYVVQKQESEIIDVCYVHAVPQSYFWSKLYKLYMLCSIGTVTSIALGIYIAWRQTKKVYQPVEKVVNELQKQTAVAYDAKSRTEFEFIEMLFDKEKKEKLTLSRTIRRGEELKRNNFIFSLLNGSISVSEKTNDVFKENGILLCSDYFCVALLRMEQCNILENNMISFVVSNVFEELCNRKHKGYVLALKDTRFVVLVNLREWNEKGEMLLLLEEGKDFLNQKFGVNFTIGVSTVQEGMQGIHAAYEEADRALGYSYLLGREIIIDYIQIAGREFRYPQAPELKMHHMVASYLSGDMVEQYSIQLVEEMLADHEIDRNASLETMEYFKFETVSMFHRVMIQEGCWSEEWKERIMMLLDQATLKDFKAYFAALLTELYRKKQEKAEEQDVCEQVKGYIEAHYAQEQLSRTLLGEMFGVAPGYLSKLFKEKYQFTIPEYISRTRVNNAKIQLRDTSFSVQKIAEENGFVNSASFIRTFKRQEGMTPNVYRDFFDEE